MAPKTSRFCAIWLSTQCRKKGQKAPCEESSSEPAGTTPISPVCWRSSEMRSPCTLAVACKMCDRHRQYRVADLVRAHGLDRPGRGSKSAVSGLYWISPEPRQARVSVLRALPRAHDVADR